MYRSFKEMPIWQRATEVAETTRGSLTETQSHVEYGMRVGYLKKKNAEELDTILCEIYGDLNKIILFLRESNK